MKVYSNYKGTVINGNAIRAIRADTPMLRGRRNRYDKLPHNNWHYVGDWQKVFWSKNPSLEEKATVENWLKKEKGLEVKEHKSVSNENYSSKLQLLTEKIFGWKLKAIINGQTYHSVVSKNTRPGEKEYRISFFEENPEDRKQLIASNHWELDESDVEYILAHKKLPERFNRDWRRYNLPEPQLIFEEKVQSSDDDLFLLEESVRELELWEENKRTS